ncbi:hypothetical protein BpHYR1_023704 [Brachionus plicatilis]|uniref:Uncharacterized protein n=1 Tax=Brachionus plicatilis TaxID=10195 RepID=A0A3M7RU92_BRAPC|nr:hypothetical protein BpHYR1_023704 [Brachionus plicatilis]
MFIKFKYLDQMKLVHIYFDIICLYNLLKINVAFSVSFTQSSYSVQYGSSVFLKATLTGFGEQGIVWRYYPTSTPSSGITVFYEGAYTSSADQSKYAVSFESSGTDIISTFEIKNTIFSDALNTYEVSCNHFRISGCSSSSFDIATIVILTTTSTTTTTSITNSISSTSSNSTCLDGAWNTVQYTLVILNFVVLVVATLLFHFSFYGTVPETFFLVLTLVLSLVLIVVSLIFWINPTLSSDSTTVPLVIICCELGACLFQWILILQYSIRLGLNNQTHLIVNVIICAIGVLELGTAILLIIANAYCTGQTSISAIGDFNYSYVELIAALLLLVFSGFIFVISGVIFFVQKKKKDNEKFSSLSKVLSPTVTPFNFPSAPNSAQPRSTFQKSKSNLSDESFPPKPAAKLAPNFAKKRNDTFVSDVTMKEDESSPNSNQELEKEPEVPKTQTPIRPKTKVFEEVGLSKPAQFGNPSFIWDSDNKFSEISKSKIALGARKASDLSENSLKTSKVTKAKTTKAKSSKDKDYLISNDDNSSTADSQFNKSGLTRISHS